MSYLAPALKNAVYFFTRIGVSRRPPSGYKEGLTLATEDCTGTDSVCGTRKRWSWTDWTQDKKPDNSFASYIMNPRVVETRVGDSTNEKVTKIDYRIVSGTSNTAEYGLVSQVRVYKGSDTTNEIKKVTTDYNLASAYTSRRMIGLPSQVEAWGRNDVTSSLEYVSKVTYGYDEENFSYESNQIITASKHDATGYGSAFVAGRGNLTSTTRHDVTATTAASVVKTRYDIAGSPVAQLDARNRKTTISYTDNFNSTVSPATYAYPTTITDPGQFSSTIQYRYDFGANIHAESPTPYGAGDGKNTSRIYDDTIGRLIKEKIDNTGAYTRYHYPNNDGVTVHTFTTVVDITGIGTIDSSDEALTETHLDGAGRVRQTRTENPNSTGGYTGRLLEYDLLGRAKRETVPTEIDSSWAPDGDDDRGSGVWLWNSREYDWKDRVTREINTDGTDKLYSYEGCGCAGGQVTTIKGEITEAIDAANQMQTTKRRTQKIVEDILGRVKETQVWDLDGGDNITPYSSTVNKYNGRDQAIVIEQHAGGASGTPQQNTTFEFDGHGRLKKSHKPEQIDSSSNPTYTTYTYNPDDTVATMTDPRGAVTNYKYSSLDDGIGTDYRPLLTKIEYTSPNTTTIPHPTDVIFTYDAAGNRKTMADGSGTLSYSYDELSRLKIETKDFLDNLTNAPDGVYKLEYSYHLAGGIRSIKDPWNAEVIYDADKIGRTTTISGMGFGAQASFATNIAYRAFGGVKSMSYATTQPTNINVTYNPRLQPATYEADSAANNVDIQNKTYAYTNDGSIKQVTDNANEMYGQTYQRDFAGRLKKNAFATVGVNAELYKQELSYDAFGHLTNRKTWDGESNLREFTAGYTDNRKTSGGYQGGTDTHDAAGNVTHNTAGHQDWRDWKFDAAGRMSYWFERSLYAWNVPWDQMETLTFDGDGRAAKRVEERTTYSSPPTTWNEPKYFIFSSVTAQKISEIDNTGRKKKTSVYMGSSVISEESCHNETCGYIEFKHTDPLTGSSIQTDRDGSIPENDSGRTELNATGDHIPTTEPEMSAPPHAYSKGGSTHNPESGCQLNYAPIACDRLGTVMTGVGSQNFYVLDHRRGSSASGPTIVRRYFDGPPGPNTPDDPQTPEDEEVIGVGSIAEWWEVRPASHTPSLSRGPKTGQGACRFNIDIRIANPGGVPQDIGPYGSMAVQGEARAELIRIFGAAGHELTFESGFRSGADASYVSSLRGDGADGNTLGFTHGENGSEYGGVHIGRLNQLANNLWFNSRATPENRFEALTAEGRGRALGRIIAHEVVAHYLLSLSNAEHTGSGLTRAAFGNEIFDEAASNQFLISSVQNAQLFLRCSRKRIPDNYAE